MVHKAFPVFCIVIFLFSACSEQESETTTITVLFTSDIHGVIYPPDNGTPGCLARVATLAQRARTEVSHVLLLDGGDTIQGNQLMYFAARNFPEKPNPIIESMNSIGYDAMAVGNHDFNFGKDYLLTTERQAEFPYLCANIINNASGQPVFQPFMIKEYDGIRVGIIGVVTNGIPNWELPEHIAGLKFLEPVEGVSNYLETVRKDEGCDVVIVVAHTGFPRVEEDGNYGEEDDERNALAIARLEGIDLLLTGHIHQLMEPQKVANTFAAICPPYARGVIRIEMFVQRSAGGEVSVECGGGFIEIDNVVPLDEAILTAAKPMIETTEDYLDTILANTPEPIVSKPERLTDSAVVDLIHSAQLEATGAELSIASLLPWGGVDIPAGPLQIRQVFDIYPYENQLLTVKMTGAQLKAFLEHAARYYDDAWVEGEVLKVDIDEEVSKYNVDNIEGLTYRIDPTRDEGDRIANLQHNRMPVFPDDEFTVVVNSYRFAGGGGFDMFDRNTVLSSAPLEAREVLINYIREHGLSGIHATDNWFISPDGQKYMKMEIDER